MTRPTRQTTAGRAYLDLQNRARRERRGTQELLTLYVVERWLARLSTYFRGTTVGPLSSAIDDIVELRAAAYAAYRRSLGADGEHLPGSFGDVVAAVTTFADPLSEAAHESTIWRAASRRWTVE